MTGEEIDMDELKKLKKTFREFRYGDDFAEIVELGVTSLFGEDKALAILIGVSPPTVSRWRRGLSQPGPRVQENVAKYFWDLIDSAVSRERNRRILEPYLAMSWEKMLEALLKDSPGRTVWFVIFSRIYGGRDPDESWDQIKEVNALVDAWIWSGPLETQTPQRSAALIRYVMRWKEDIEHYDELVRRVSTDSRWNTWREAQGDMHGIKWSSGSLVFRPTRDDEGYKAWREKNGG